MRVLVVAALWLLSGEAVGMTRLARKLANLCANPGCTEPPLEDNCRCRLHRDKHRETNRRWWRKTQSAQPA